MQGLSIEANLAPIEGTRVSQVCIAMHQCILWLDNGDRISVESTCVLSVLGHVALRIQQYASAAPELCSLLDKQISAARREANGGLTLEFQHGTRLDILNDNLGYESFQVHIGATVLVASALI